jgi:hypothetical protein
MQQQLNIASRRVGELTDTPPGRGVTPAERKHFMTYNHHCPDNPFIREGRINFRCFEEWRDVGFTALTGWSTCTGLLTDDPLRALNILREAAGLQPLSDEHDEIRAAVRRRISPHR